MNALTGTAVAALTCAAEKNPLGAYACTVQHGQPDAALRAAHIALRTPLLGTWAPELEHISGAQYHRLLAFHRACAASNGAWRSADSVTRVFPGKCGHRARTDERPGGGRGGYGLCNALSLQSDVGAI